MIILEEFPAGQITHHGSDFDALPQASLVRVAWRDGVRPFSQGGLPAQITQQPLPVPFQKQPVLDSHRQVRLVLGGEQRVLGHVLQDIMKQSSVPLLKTFAFNCQTPTNLRTNVKVQ